MKTQFDDDERIDDSGGLLDDEKRLNEEWEKIRATVDNPNATKDEIRRAGKMIDRVATGIRARKTFDAVRCRDGGFDFRTSGASETRAILRKDDAGFANFGDYLQTVRAAYLTPGFRDSRLERRAISGLGEKNPSDGGFLVGEQFTSDIIERIYQDAPVLGMLDTYEVKPGSNAVVLNGYDETSRANGSRWGGVRGYWSDEGAAMTASQPQYLQMSLALERLTALVYATDELIEDAPNLAKQVADAARKELEFKVLDAVMNGDGSGKPLGIISANCLVSVTKETSQTADTIVAENAIKIYSQVWASSKQRGVWLANADTLPQLMTMSIAVGTGGIPVWQPANQMAGRPYDTLMGRPIYYLEQSPTLGDAGDLLFAHLAEYAFIRKPLQTAVSIHVSFTSGQTCFRFVWRVNGQPKWESAVTPFKGSNTQSPFVCVAARE